MGLGEQNRPKRIVILGAGFAGAYCARELEKRLRSTAHEIYLIDRQNYFIFYPLLIEAGTGGVEPRHAVIPLRPFLRQTHFHTGEIQFVDPRMQTVFYSVPASDQVREVHYDHLVIALGSTAKRLPIPGLAEHAWEMKNLMDAIALRDHAIQMLELAESIRDATRRTAALQFVIIGGNFTGVELAGQLQELLRQASRYYRHVEAAECRVILIELADRILTPLDQELSHYAAEHLSRLGVNIRLRTSVEQITPEFVRLSTGEQLAANTVISCIGVAPNPLIPKLSLPNDSLDKRGYILCDRDLRIRGLTNVWAVGDCAVITDAQGNPYPQTAQHAIGEARVLAGNIAAVLSGQPTVPCDIKSRGSLAAIGEHRGVARVGRFRFAGLSAWLIDRAYYLWQIPGWSRKLRIASDWLWDLLFSRDYVQLGAHRNRSSTGETRRVA